MEALHTGTQGQGVERSDVAIPYHPLGMAAEEFRSKQIQNLNGSVTAPGCQYALDPGVIERPFQVIGAQLGSRGIAIEESIPGMRRRDCTEAHSFHGSDGSVKLFIIKMIGRANNSYAVARFKQGRCYHTANIVKKV